jgi:hypothetical protein
MHFCRYSADTHAVRKAHQQRNRSCTAVSAWLHSCNADNRIPQSSAKAHDNSLNVVMPLEFHPTREK